MSFTLPKGIDWELTYRPATLAFLQGHNPYDADIAPKAPFFAAPWGLILLIPFAIWPVAIGRALLLITTLISFAYTAHKLGANKTATTAFLLSPPVMHCLLNANIEWIPLLGFVLPPQIALLFLAVKPQTGFAVIIFWLFEAWRIGGWHKIIEYFWPLALTTLISFGLYGLWPLRFGAVMGIARGFNASLWPLSIPIGLTLIVSAIYHRQIKYAMPASPCLAPYTLFHSWSSALVALSAHPVEMVTAVIGLWILIIIQAT